MSSFLPVHLHIHDVVISIVAPTLLLFLTARELAFMGGVNKWWSAECKRPKLLDHKRLGVHVPYRPSQGLPPSHILPIITKLCIGIADMNEWIRVLSCMVHLRHLGVVPTRRGERYKFCYVSFFSSIPASVRVLNCGHPAVFGFVAVTQPRTFPLIGIRGLECRSSYQLPWNAPNITALKTASDDPCPSNTITPNLRFIHFGESLTGEEERIWGNWMGDAFSESDLSNVETIIVDMYRDVSFSPSVSSSLKYLRIGMFDMEQVLLCYHSGDESRIFGAPCESLRLLEVLLLHWGYPWEQSRLFERLSFTFNSVDYPSLFYIRIVVARDCISRTCCSDFQLRDGLTFRVSVVDPALQLPSLGDDLDYAFKYNSLLGSAQQAFDRYVDSQE